MCLDGRRIFLTGATGFIGNHLLSKLLQSKARVIALVRNRDKLPTPLPENFEIVDGDLFEMASIEKGCHNAQIVINLAGLTAANSKVDYERVNVQGAANVAKAAQKSPSKPLFVQVSSQAANGPASKGEKTIEDMVPQPVSEYGRSKLAGEQSVIEATKGKAIIVRPTVVYGPGDKEVFPIFYAVSFGFFPLLNRQAQYSWTFVDDIVEGIMAAALKGTQGEVYNLSSSEIASNSVLAESFSQGANKRLINLPIPAFMVSLAGAFNELLHWPFGHVPVFNRGKVQELLADSWVADTQKANNALDFQSKTSLKEGIAATFAWYRSEGWL